jgi:hypothetical protein
VRPASIAEENTAGGAHREGEEDDGTWMKSGEEPVTPAAGLIQEDKGWGGGAKWVIRGPWRVVNNIGRILLLSGKSALDSTSQPAE